MQVRLGPAFKVALVVGLTFAAFDAHAQSNQPTAMELAQLPKFCWGQFHVPNVAGDEFAIRNCGYSANHYCHALIYVIRARSPSVNKRGRMDLLGHADTDIRYTENAIKDYPKCSIRDDVLKSRIEVNNLLRMYGGKPLPPPK